MKLKTINLIHHLLKMEVAFRETERDSSYDELDRFLAAHGQHGMEEEDVKEYKRLDGIRQEKLEAYFEAQAALQELEETEWR